VARVRMLKQIRLNDDQISAFFNTEFEQDQLNHFESLFENIDFQGVIVDVGAGVGNFARLLTNKRKNKVRVLDIDPRSIEIAKGVGDNRIEAVVADAINPIILGDESVVTINLILHHLIGLTEATTRDLQESDLRVWLGKTDYICQRIHI
jgi:2-polyprenyl-3-methyl-5-hydroxy-6-metoxy-1,4-benzoquinol methylase